MIYRVVMDGNDILNYEEKEYVLLAPSLQMELNTAGSFEFTMPPGHSFYDEVRLLLSTIEVYEDGELLWFGRPVDIHTDYFKQKKVYCEGALTFFNDSVQRPCVHERISLHEFFRTVIGSHNEQVAEARRFTVGEVTVPDKKVYRKLHYESTFEVLKKQCLNAEGGYFFIRREEGESYIDWLSEMPYTCNQPVEFGLNLLDITSGFDGSGLATCVLPLGEEDSSTGEPLTVESVNGGSDVIESEAVDTYGRITRAVSFSGVKYPRSLYADGVEYLQDKQFSNLAIECSAAELHLQNGSYEQFRVGQTVRCRSIPHLVDREFPLMKMSVRLDTAAKQITLGSVKKPTLTQIQRETDQTLEGITGGDLGDLENRIAALEDPDIRGQVDPIDMEDLLGDILTRLDEEDLQGLFPENEFEFPLTPEQLEGLLPDGILAQVEGANEQIANLNDLVSQINDSLLSLSPEEQAALAGQIQEIKEELTQWQNQMDDYFHGNATGEDLTGTMEGIDTGVADCVNYAEDTSVLQAGDIGGLSKHWTHQINGVEVEEAVINFVTE